VSGSKPDAVPLGYTPFKKIYLQIMSILEQILNYFNRDVFPQVPDYYCRNDASHDSLLELKERIDKDLAASYKLFFISIGILTLVTCFGIGLFYGYYQLKINEFTNQRVNFYRMLLNILVQKYYFVSLFDFNLFIKLPGNEINSLDNISIFLDSIRYKILNKIPVDRANVLEFSIYQTILMDMHINNSIDILSNNNYPLLVKNPLTKIILELQYSSKQIQLIFNS
jgi:hypothetical protein